MYKVVSARLIEELQQQLNDFEKDCEKNGFRTTGSYGFSAEGWLVVVIHYFKLTK